MHATHLQIKHKGLLTKVDRHDLARTAQILTTVRCPVLFARIASTG